MGFWQDLRWGLGELFYPRQGRCPLCRTAMPPGNVVCATCQALVARWQQDYPLCPRCGRLLSLPVAAAGQVDARKQAIRVCLDCRRYPPPFTWARAAGLYSGHLQQAIHRFKYAGQRRLAHPLAYLLDLALEHATNHLPGGPPTFDLIVPVPLHPRRLARRSFNQAAVLAAELASRRHLSSAADALARIRDTRSQVGLGRAKRLANLEGAFVVTGTAAVSGHTILLVDDTFTTGATVRECSRVLLAAGARSVCVLTVATGGLRGNGW